jgi:hypothetical protein
MFCGSMPLHPQESLSKEPRGALNLAQVCFKCKHVEKGIYGTSRQRRRFHMTARCTVENVIREQCSTSEIV